MLICPNEYVDNLSSVLSGLSVTRVCAFLTLCHTVHLRQNLAITTTTTTTTTITSTTATVMKSLGLVELGEDRVE